MRRGTFTKLKLATLIATVAGLAALTGSAQSQSSTTTGSSVDQSQTAGTSTADRKTTSFIKQVAEDNDAEVAFGELGTRQAQNANLKSFAQQLQRDHMQANDQLRPIAQKYGITLNQELKHKDNRVLTKLGKESGAKFDQEFATEALRMHQKDIDKFQKAVSDLQAPDVRQYAETMLPKLREHFQHAETVAKEVGVDQATISSIEKKLPAGVGGTSSESEQGSGSASDQNPKQGAGAKDLQKDNAAPQSQ
jgi:putative membrane protein